MLIKKYKAKEDSLLRRFKNQNTLVKAFGKDVLRVYNLLTHDYVSESQLFASAQEIGFQQQDVLKILKFMEEEGMLDIIETEEEVIETPKQPKKEKLVERYLPKPQPTTLTTQQPVERKETIPKEMEKEAIEEFKEIEKPQEEELEKTKIIEHQPDIETELEELEKNLLSLESGTEKTEEQKQMGKAEIEEPHIEEPTIETKEVREGDREKEGSVEDRELSIESIDIGEGGGIGEEREERKEAYSPSESVIFERYGKKGVEVFRLVDGRRTIREIAEQAGVDISYVTDVLEYAEQQGLISLGSTNREESEEPKFSPLTSEKLEESYIQEEDPIHEIRLNKKDVMKMVSSKLNIILKFGKAGRKIFEYLEKHTTATDVDIAKDLEVEINIVDEVVELLKKEGLLTTSVLSRREIEEKFGYDSYIIYKKYGRKGVLFYELLGKEEDIKRIAQLINEKDKGKVVEIFEMIHKILGIPLPIEKEVLRKHLESS